MRRGRLLRVCADLAQGGGVLLGLSGLIAADPALMWSGIAAVGLGLAAGVGHRMRYP